MCDAVEVLQAFPAESSCKGLKTYLAFSLLPDKKLCKNSPFCPGLLAMQGVCRSSPSAGDFTRYGSAFSRVLPVARFRSVVYSSLRRRMTPGGGTPASQSAAASGQAQGSCPGMVGWSARRTRALARHARLLQPRCGRLSQFSEETLRHWPLLSGAFRYGSFPGGAEKPGAAEPLPRALSLLRPLFLPLSHGQRRGRYQSSG